MVRSRWSVADRSGRCPSKQGSAWRIETNGRERRHREVEPQPVILRPVERSQVDRGLSIDAIRRPKAPMSPGDRSRGDMWRGRSVRLVDAPNRNEAGWCNIATARSGRRFTRPSTRTLRRSPFRPLAANATARPIRAVPDPAVRASSVAVQGRRLFRRMMPCATGDRWPADRDGEPYEAPQTTIQR